MITKEAFVKQFPHKVTNTGEILEYITYSHSFQGIKVYNALNLLLIKVNGEYYATGK